MQNQLSEYKDLIGFLSATLPDGFNAALLDLTKKSCPVIEQSDWSGKEIEAVRKYVDGLLRKGVAEKETAVVNRLITVGSSALYRLSVQFLKEAGRPVYALCLFMDMSFPLRLNHFVQGFLKLNGEDGVPIPINEVQEEQSSQPGELDDIPSIVAAFAEEPEKMTPAERQEVCCDLYDAGVFRLKGAIEKTAEALGVSEQTVYRYVSAIRKARS